MTKSLATETNCWEWNTKKSGVGVPPPSLNPPSGTVTRTMKPLKTSEVAISDSFCKKHFWCSRCSLTRNSGCWELFRSTLGDLTEVTQTNDVVTRNIIQSLYIYQSRCATAAPTVLRYRNYASHTAVPSSNLFVKTVNGENLQTTKQETKTRTRI